MKKLTPKIDLEQAYIDLKQRFDKLEENMVATEAMLRKEIEAKQAEVNQRDERISALQTEIARLKVELAKSDILNDKIAQLQKEVERLEGERMRLIKEKDELIATFKAEQDRSSQQMKDLHTHLDRVEEQLKAFGDKDKIIHERDEMILQKEREIAKKDTIIGEKDKIIAERDAELKTLKEKSELSYSSQEKLLKDKDAFFIEKENLMKAKITAETKVQALEKEIQDLRRKMRESGDGLLGSSMEIENLKEKLKQKEQEIQKMNERLLSLTTGNTGIIMEMPDLIRIMQDKFLKGKRNVRIVVPNISDFERHGFIPLLDKLPPQAAVYVAAAIDPTTQEGLINTLRDKKVQLQNFQDGNMYGLNVDGALCLLSIVAEDDPNKILAGFYTDIEAAVPIFKDAIQKAWVKGTKI